MADRPDPDALRFYMRKAGYRAAARGLPSRIQRAGGVPFTYTEGNDRIRIRYGVGNSFVAVDMLEVPPVLIATQFRACVKREPQPRSVPLGPGGPMPNVTFRCPRKLRREIEQLRRGEPFAASIRDILERYVKAAKGGA